MNNREEKWEYIREEICNLINYIETPDKEMEIMKFNILSNLLRMTETEEIFNDVLDILNKNKNRILRKENKE